jgi:hypothetical protein
LVRIRVLVLGVLLASTLFIHVPDMSLFEVWLIRAALLAGIVIGVAWLVRSREPAGPLEP